MYQRRVQSFRVGEESLGSREGEMSADACPITPSEYSSPEDKGSLILGEVCIFTSGPVIEHDYCQLSVEFSYVGTMRLGTMVKSVRRRDKTEVK